MGEKISSGTHKPVLGPLLTHSTIAAIGNGHCNVSGHQSLILSWDSHVSCTAQAGWGEGEGRRGRRGGGGYKE